MSKKLKRGDLVSVVWSDSFRHSSSEYWASYDEITYKNLGYMRSIGIYQRRNGRFLTIAQTASDEGDLGGAFSIPVACIKSIGRVSEK